MAKPTYIQLYLSYLDAIEPLGDAERGRLFTACLLYSKTGAVPDLGGNERFIFPMMRAQIDRDNEAYEEKCRKNSNNRKGSSTDDNDRQRPSTDVTKEKEKKKEKKKEKEKDTPLSPPVGDLLVDDSALPDAVKAKLRDWLAYKNEKRQPYKPTGIKSLITQVANNCEKYSDQAVIDCIDLSMANNWQGIIWDRVQQSGKTPGPSKRDAPGKKSFSELIAERTET